MKNLRLVRLVRREIRAVLRLSPWVLGTLLLAALLWQADLSAISGLFQSPPTETPTPEPTTPAPTETPTLAPTEAPTEVPTATLAPSDTPGPTASPTELPATATETPVTPTEAPQTATPVPSPTGDGVEAETDESQRYADDESDLKFEWGMLFDSVALGISYLWLCCGVFVLLAIPLFFLILWVVSKRRQQPEE